MERVNYLSSPQVINLFIYPDLRDTIKRTILRQKGGMLIYKISGKVISISRKYEYSPIYANRLRSLSLSVGTNQRDRSLDRVKSNTSVD